MAGKRDFALKAFVAHEKHGEFLVERVSDCVDNVLRESGQSSMSE